MTHKRRSKCAARKYNLKVLKRYHSFNPHDTYFASLPTSCLHQEENDQLDGVLDSSNTNNTSATLILSPTIHSSVTKEIEAGGPPPTTRGIRRASSQPPSSIITKSKAPAKSTSPAHINFSGKGVDRTSPGLATLLLITPIPKESPVTCHQTVQSDALKQYEPIPIIDHLCFSKSKTKIFTDSSTNDSEADEHDISINEESNSLRKRIRNHPRYLFKDITTKEQEQIHINMEEELVEAAMITHKLGQHKAMFVNNNYLVISGDDKIIANAIFINQRSELIEEIKRITVNYLSKCCQEVVNDLYEDFEVICAKTKSNYADWHKAPRRFRITSSVYYNIFIYKKNKNPDWKNFFTC
ncbi:hypothetical protein PV327_010063 [Microctonus hyperodae]|uniref:Uncharacterized protein n=1 Tax=Microctonus hyperodae TaxID=165561 RepID=A0AA39F295_MICHY|nr:hypothetical protein PV327_010063 [Microctonus hyperodae]